MDWVSKVLTGGALLRDLSWSFSCPSHCGTSATFPFLSGLGVGALLGLLFGLWISLQASRLLSSLAHPPQAPPETRGPTPPASRRRLSGYLVHEWNPYSGVCPRYCWSGGCRPRADPCGDPHCELGTVDIFYDCEGFWWGLGDSWGGVRTRGS